MFLSPFLEKQADEGAGRGWGTGAGGEMSLWDTVRDAEAGHGSLSTDPASTLASCKAGQARFEQVAAIR